MRVGRHFVEYSCIKCSQNLTIPAFLMNIPRLLRDEGIYSMQVALSSRQFTRHGFGIHVYVPRIQTGYILEARPLTSDEDSEPICYNRRAWNPCNTPFCLTTPDTHICLDIEPEHMCRNQLLIRLHRESFLSHRNNGVRHSQTYPLE